MGAGALQHVCGQRLETRSNHNNREVRRQPENNKQTIGYYEEEMMTGRMII